MAVPGLRESLDQRLIGSIEEKGFAWSDPCRGASPSAPEKRGELPHRHGYPSPSAMSLCSLDFRRDKSGETIDRGDRQVVDAEESEVLKALQSLALSCSGNPADTIDPPSSHLWSENKQDGRALPLVRCARTVDEPFRGAVSLIS